MASTTALYTGLSGLNAHSRSLEVIGNNIANVNTPAFKSSRANFQDAFYRTLSPGSEPRDALGGTNPYQIGMGVNISGTQRDMRAGTISATRQRYRSILGTEVPYFVREHKRLRLTVPTLLMIGLKDTTAIGRDRTMSPRLRRKGCYLQHHEGTGSY